MIIRLLHPIDLVFLRLRKSGFEVLSETFLYFKVRSSHIIWHLVVYIRKTTVNFLGYFIENVTSVLNLCIIAVMCKILYKLPSLISSLPLVVNGW